MQEILLKCLKTFKKEYFVLINNQKKLIQTVK